MNERVIRDRARDLWWVEETGCTGGAEETILRYRHEMGFEVLVAADAPLDEMNEAALVDALERTRRRLPRKSVRDAA